jgi:hypothetical protein
LVDAQFGVPLTPPWALAKGSRAAAGRRNLHQGRRRR